MRTVPAELAGLIPIDAHDGVAYVVDEFMTIHKFNDKAMQTWLWALSVWNARQIVDIQRRLEPPPYEGG